MVFRLPILLPAEPVGHSRVSHLVRTAEHRVPDYCDLQRFQTARPGANAGGTVAFRAGRGSRCALPANEREGAVDNYVANLVLNAPVFSGRIDAWELPFLAKYRLPLPVMKPYIESRANFRAISASLAQHMAARGFSAGIGVDLASDF